MQEKANPAMVAAAVVLLVLVVGFLGWKFMGPGSKDSGKNPYGNMGGSNGPPSQYMPRSTGGTMQNGSYGSPGSGSPGSGSPGSGGSYGSPGSGSPGSGSPNTGG